MVPKQHQVWGKFRKCIVEDHKDDTRSGTEATFNFLVSHLHPPPRGDGGAETAAAETEGVAEMPSSHACEGSTFIKSRRTLSPWYYEHVRQMLHDLNGHGGGSQMAFQFSYHAVRNHVLVSFRPSLKDCTGQVTLSQALSLLLGCPDQETVLMGRGSTCHMAPSQPWQDPVESLFVHCDLDADAPVVGNSGIACCTQCPPKVATVRSCATSLSNWIGFLCTGQSSSTSTWL